MHIEIDRLWFADLKTFFTAKRVETQTRVLIQSIGGRDRLSEGNIYRLAFYETPFKYARYTLRANIHTIPAKIAFLRIDIGRVLANANTEISDITGDFFHFAIGHQGNLWMSGDFDHLRGKNALGTIKSREGLGELCHMPANRRFLLDQNDIETALGHIQRGLNPTDPAADHQTCF